MCNFAIFPSTVGCEGLRHRLRRRVRLQGAMNCSTLRKRLVTSGLSAQNLSRNNKVNSRPGREIHAFRRRLKRGTPWRSSTGKTTRYTEARCSQLPCISRPPRQLSGTQPSSRHVSKAMASANSEYEYQNSDFLRRHDTVRRGCATVSVKRPGEGGRRNCSEAVSKEVPQMLSVIEQAANTNFGTISSRDRDGTSGNQVVRSQSSPCSALRAR